MYQSLQKIPISSNSLKYVDLPNLLARSPVISYKLGIVIYISLFFCLQDFSDVSKEMGVSVGIKHKKINISNPRVRTY
jgi:hypothetical protein